MLAGRRRVVPPKLQDLDSHCAQLVQHGPSTAHYSGSGQSFVHAQPCMRQQLGMQGSGVSACFLLECCYLIYIAQGHETIATRDTICGTAAGDSPGWEATQLPNAAVNSNRKPTISPTVVNAKSPVSPAVPWTPGSFWFCNHTSGLYEPTVCASVRSAASEALSRASRGLCVSAFLRCCS
jgi:hypothetical protein